MTTYQTGSVPVCPHCAKSLDDRVEDFVSPANANAGLPEENDCGWCDRLFDVRKTGPDTFEVTKKAGTR